MQVIPAINATDLETVKKQAILAKTFSSWIHIDVADGKFTKAILWNNPKELSKVKSKKSKVKIEVHLMVEEPEKVAKEWLKMGAGRVIAHVEAVQNLEALMKLDPDKLILALNPETPADEIIEHLEYRRKVKRVLLLAVKPGWAGQKFDKVVLDKIKQLKRDAPGVIIEVDGGINLETAKLCKEAGADVVIAASYIFGSENPEEAYQELSNI